MEDLKDINLYELLGISVTSSTQDVKKAYRKKALSCHPDKNPDNPKAAQLFHQLSKVLEILIDESARAAYDKVLNAKQAAKLRNSELDSRRKKLKEDLERQERADEARRAPSFDSRTPEERLQAEIERLRKEGSKQVAEEQEYVRQQVLRESRVDALHASNISTCEETSLYSLKLKWNSSRSDPTNGGYNHKVLQTIFAKYGDIAALIVSRTKKGSALLEFNTLQAAVKAQQTEKGLASNALTVEWVSGKPPPPLTDLKDTSRQATESTPAFIDVEATKKNDMFGFIQTSLGTSRVLPSRCNDNSTRQRSDEMDFEDMVLRKMQEAEEKKRIRIEIENDKELTGIE